jgi:polyferredoxin
MKKSRQKIRRILLLVSMLAFPVTLYYFSPYLIINGAFSGILAGSGITFAAQFLFSLVLGRAFCGWVCPAGAIQEFASVNTRSVDKKWVNAIKYIIWLPWLATIVLAFIKAGGIHAVDLTYMTQNGFSVADAPGYIMYAFITSLFLLGAVFFGRRATCHSLCWMAPFMIIGTRISKGLHLPALHLQAQPDACVSCQLCNRKCSMGLDVQQMVLQNRMHNDECILCGECVDVCNKDAIRYAFSEKKR